MMNKSFLQFTRTIYIHRIAWMTTPRMSLFSPYSNLTLSQRNIAAAPSAPFSTSKIEFKNSYNENFMAFHNRLHGESSDFTMTNSEWEKLVQDILEEDPTFVNHVDYSIMKSLSSKPELCLSFYNYIKSKREPNISTMIEFIINVAESYDDLVLEEVKKLTKICDSTAFRIFGWKVAFGVAKSNHWREAVNYMNLDYESSLSIEVPAFAMRTLALVFKKSIKCQDYKTFHKVSRKFFPVLQQADDKSVISQTFFNYWKDGMIPTDLFMELLKLAELPLEEDEIALLETHCNKEWEPCKSATQMEVQSESLMCLCCGEKMPQRESTVNESILKEMLDKILEMVVPLGRRKAVAEELQNLADLIKVQDRQFDYVIDGPNVGNHYLKSILKILKKQDKHVLVIVTDNRKNEFTIRKDLGTYLFLQKGLYVSDDIFILLAALMSGPDCYVVTNDDFRDHIDSVDLKFKPYFYAWRDQRRVFHLYNKLLHPPIYKWTAHESDSGWHIPCKKATPVTKKETEIPNALLTELYARRFLCVRKSTNYVPSPELVAFRLAASQTDIS